ncbi:MAG TPA: DoxX family protein [Gemmatimonadaceae bacterium]|nr:DoxX family protein [Gemmatimonadaceae bacterium]
MSRAHWIATLCRVFCGIVFIVHGTPKIMNLQDTSEWFTGIGFPGWVAIPVAILEFFGGILLVVGFLTRILSGLFIIEMIVAAIKVHFPYGFEVFHLGDPMARGYEYNVALILLLLVVVLLGAGPVSIDGAIAGRKGDGSAPEERGAV